MDPAHVKSWRRSERERLLALRGALAPAERRRASAAIEEHLRALLEARLGGTAPGPVLGAYWPFRGEFDPRPLVDWMIAAGGRVALPVVIDKTGPLEYRAWRPGESLVDGVWNIPVPERREVVVPDIVLAPLVGFDRAGYRLGYGGGYFDRTLAHLSPRPTAIGVGFAAQRLATIHPQPFDIAMDAIVTEDGIARR
jgi:5-formyltetrahydrofolate cyclo-ligase